MDIYTKTAENLGKLRRNEAKMSQEQFVQYASVLKKYRTDIAAGAGEILKRFWLGGMMVEKGVKADALRREVQQIIDDEAAKGEMKRLKDILFQTYSLDEFLNAACRVCRRIRYEAYAPYWVSRCVQRPLPDGIPWAGIPASGTAWHNSMIDMYWDDRRGIWAAEKEAAWRSGLPPTKELCEAEYAKERKATGSA